MMIGLSVPMFGCNEDLTVDSAAGIELDLIDKGQANIFGTPRSTFKANKTVVWGRERDLSLDVHYNDHTYIDDVGGYNREDGYICRVLGECGDN